MDRKNLQRIRNLDVFEAAEALTGKSYKDDNQTTLLGLQLAMVQNKLISDHQKAVGDSFSGITHAAFLELAYAEGFRLIHTKEFKGESWRGEPEPDEKYFSLWNDEGVLLTVETYGDRVNVSNLYYNLTNYPEHSGSSSWHEGVLIGNCDVRQDFRATMRSVRAAGIVKPWVKRPFLWLLTYTDAKTSSNDYKRINEEMISNYPEDIRLCMGK